MLSYENLRLQFGPKIIFEGCTFTVAMHDRVGLVGPNGAGKSTLLKLLAGLIEADDVVTKNAKGITIGYLPQDGVETHGKPLVEEVETAFADILGLRKLIDETGERLESIDHASEEYLETLEMMHEWEQQLADAEPAKIRPRVERVLLGLGFSMEDMTRDTGEFSGGWQMRIALAKLLLREPSLLLMDEPTNHLDIESQAWIEAWLKRYRGAVMMVSHDKSFLDTVTNRTFALEGDGKLEAYFGNYTYYKTTAAERREQLRKAFEIQQREIEHHTDFINRFRASANKATQVQSRIKFLEKLERVVYIEEDTSQIGFRFPEPPRSGQVVLEFAGMAKWYDDLCVFKNVDFRLERGDRVAIVGVNGAGKSTFVKMLAGRESLTGGDRIEGPNSAISYFAQHQAQELDPTLTVFETVNEVAVGEGTTRLRTLLGAFLFRGEDALKPVRVLSGGERNRLALARMLLRPFNCLILDEPTNHLDMKSKAVLTEAIKNFPGTVVVVSHDRDFLDPIVTKVLEVRKGGIRIFPGNVSYYLEATAAERAATNAEPSSSAPGKLSAATGTSGASANAAQNDGKQERKKTGDLNKRLAPQRKKAAELEKRIGEIEAKIVERELAMTDPAFFQRGTATKADMDAYETLKKELDSVYETWGALTEEIAAAELAG
jgi:ATP-binding cassette subfamily F protein 3